jgi:hypothetical protein
MFDELLRMNPVACEGRLRDRSPGLQAVGVPAGAGCPDQATLYQFTVLRAKRENMKQDWQRQ